MPGRVEFTVIDSGFAKAGSHVVVDVKPAEGGGSTLQITWDRRARAFAGFYSYFVTGWLVLQRGLERAVLGTNPRGGQGFPNLDRAKSWHRMQSDQGYWRIVQRLS